MSSVLSIFFVVALARLRAENTQAIHTHRQKSSTTLIFNANTRKLKHLLTWMIPARKQKQRLSQKEDSCKTTRAKCTRRSSQRRHSKDSSLFCQFEARPEKQKQRKSLKANAKKQNSQIIAIHLADRLLAFGVLQQQKQRIQNQLQDCVRYQNRRLHRA